jgi:hypothetical protein
MNIFEKGKNFVLLLGIKPQLSGSPVHSLVAILTMLSDTNALDSYMYV